MRAANWLLGDKAHTGYFGSVGKDDNADILKHEANKEGVFTHFCVDDSKPTGTCAALITDHKRSLVANLAAAEAFKVSVGSLLLYCCVLRGVLRSSSVDRWISHARA